jgi:sugar lactone lactonase YvrE
VNRASAQAYTWTTFVGLPTVSGTNNGTRSAALFNQPTGTIEDAAGNLYIADEQNNLIRKCTANGVVTAFAGSAGNTGTNDGTGTNALFNQPSNLAFDSAGNIFVADTFNHTIRKITPAGLVSTFAGLGGTPGFKNGTGSGALFNQPNGIAFDSSNNLYVADGVNGAVRRVTTNAVVSTVATGFYLPEQVAVDKSNIIYVDDAGNNVIRKMTPAGVVSLLAGSGAIGSKDGTGAGAEFNYPESLTVDSSSNVFVADYGNDTIRMITPAGVVTTIGGQVGIMGTNDATGTNALFNQQEGISVDKSDNIYVADTQNNTIRIGLAPGAVPLGMQRVGGQLVLTWTNSAFSLQSAPTANGTYTNSPTAISPYTNSTGSGQQYFRLKGN